VKSKLARTVISMLEARGYEVEVFASLFIVKKQEDVVVVYVTRSMSGDRMSARSWCPALTVRNITTANAEYALKLIEQEMDGST